MAKKRTQPPAQPWANDVQKRMEELSANDSQDAFDRLVQAAHGIDAASLDALIEMLLEVRERMDEGPQWTH